MATILERMQQRRDTAANWTSVNPVLASGEIGWETDTAKGKIGNGSSTWTSLPYVISAVASTPLASGVSYDATTSAGDSGSPIAAYTVQDALDWLNRDVTDRDELMYLVTKRDTLLSVYALAGANSQSTSEGWIPGLAPNGAQSVNSGTAVTLANPSIYPVQDVKLNGVTPVITLPNAYVGARLTVLCRQDGTGGRVGTFAAASGDSLKWPAATAPTLTTTANTVDIIKFHCTVTTVWLGYRAAADVR